MIEFGTVVEDSVTGFIGTVTGRCEYMTGCTQYEVTPKVDKDGQLQKGAWLDESRLAEHKEPALNAKPGGPQGNPPTERSHP